jgi:hypothetical protein
MAVLVDKDGRPVGFICGRGGGRPKRCAYCGLDSSKLCDFKVEITPGAGVFRTCDVPMCHLHTFSPRVEIDYCRDHRPAEKEARP